METNSTSTIAKYKHSPWLIIGDMNELTDRNEKGSMSKGTSTRYTVILLFT